METTWQPLRVTALPKSCPPLFSKYQSAPNSYVVYLTDLSHVWKESMDRKSIFKRALMEETPIDPTEDAGQMQLLLRHIRSAVNGEKGTRRQLIRNAKDPDSPSLHLTTPLPGSLGDLQWTVHFESLPTESVRQHLVSPLMSKVYNQMQQVDDLVGLLNAKDHVISKLLDRLEGSGMDITSVFPGVSGAKGSKHSTSREQAARQVQGLGVFNHQEWQRNHRAAQGFKIPDEKFAGVLKMPAADNLDDSKDTGSRWLTALPSTVGEDEDSNPTSDAEGDVTMDEDVPDADEDIFERQDTPPRLKKSRPHQSLADAKPSSDVPRPTSHHDETTDDEDFDAPSSQPPKPVHTSADPPSASLSIPTKDASVLSPKPKRLGRLGGRSEQKSTDVPADKAGTPTASETEDEDGLAAPILTDSTPHPDASANEQAAKAPVRKGKLGVLGGKKAPNSANISASSTPTHRSSPESASASNKVRSKIVGKGSNESSSEAPVETAIPSATVRTESLGSVPERNSSSKVSGVPPESEQERANRKREELKRELEKSQGPKKKRKF